MNGQLRFEWSWSGAGPDDWTLLGDAVLEQVTAACHFPGWFLPGFEFWDDCSGMSLECRFSKWASDEAGTAEYVATGCYGALSFGIVLAREVPACLVFSCALTAHLGNQTFQATFTTLAGNETHRIQDTLPGFLTLGHLLDDLADALEAKDMLQSRNQRIRLVLNNGPIELPRETVLWSNAAQKGWLQPGTENN